MEISHPMNSKLLEALFLLALTLMISIALAAGDPYSEALFSLKSELKDEYNSLGDWTLASGNDPSGKIQACSWSGVQCNHNSTSVIGLDLSMRSLGGELPGEYFHLFTELGDLNLSYNLFSGQLPVGIFNLTGLTSLDISRNNFSGRFPEGVFSGVRSLVVLDAFSNSFSGPLPPEVSQLESLKVLNLAGSYFDGPIPREFGYFRSLEFIHLAGNFLAGEIPPDLGRLKTVTHMEIGYNSYQGSIPWQLGNMSELQYLDIAGANLSGTIPKELSNLTNLQSLFLFRNQLTGPVPPEFSKLVSLESLDLSVNLLSGPIPESLAELKHLKLLSLMLNEMNGSVPQGIAQLPSLETLLIWSNHFSGSLPDDLGRNSKLKWVDVSTNNLIGTIPAHICSQGELFKLILFSNSFTGSLSPSISNCSSLVRLRIEDNSFSGEIPLKFSSFPDISYLDLSRNNFSGGIPADISSASMLEYFNISSNPELGGTIPPEIWSLPALQNFSASACNISGNLPSFQSCKSVSVIELHLNNLMGNLPPSVSHCQALERFDLADNSFIGNVPEELASLSALTVLDLSHNHFTGPLPEKLSDLSSLEVLNVSYNDLSGSIPSTNLFQQMGSSAYEGNPKLCSAPLLPCSASAATFGTRGTRKFLWVLLLCIAVIAFVIASAFGILYMRRRRESKWRTVSFSGLPRFTPDDVLRSIRSSPSIEAASPLSSSACKSVLPTGITVAVERVEVETKEMQRMIEFMTRLGNARHKNLTRVLGFCYNKRTVYLLHDYLPNGNLAEKIGAKRDWVSKYKLVMAIARGLSFLHHDCRPAIPHGDLKSSNVLFDENMEPHLAGFGFKYLEELAKGSSPAIHTPAETDEYNSDRKEEQLYRDVYSFGEIILEILTNGSRLTNSGGMIIQSKPIREALLREVYSENNSAPADSKNEEIQLVLEVALQCTRSRPADRPSMADAVKLLSRWKPQ